MLPTTVTALLFGFSQLNNVLAISQYTALHEPNFDLYGTSPAPTPGPRLLELKGRNPGDLQKRQSSLLTKTCGYFDGVLSDPFTCDDDDGGDYACAYNNDKNYFGCCSVSAGQFVLSDCPNVNNPYTGCYPYESASACTGACYYQNRVCGSVYPFCGINLMRTGSATYTAYYCNSVQAGATYTVLASWTTTDYPSSTTSTRTTTRTVTSTTRTTTTPSSIRSTTPTTTATTSLSSPDTNNQVVTSTPRTPSATAPPVSATSGTVQIDDNNGGTNVGAIAGGVVGGVLGLALIIGGIVYYLHRKKVAERKEARMEISQVQ
ncbi:hypothetical protein LTS08_003937 [Lithohypha guttulata]|uniref:uncharacterized protein n=1 Tax=Lithohypha guttulata TaxID=1690604 RepID=UPI002DDF7871|nr:hypothetical protein LTR51_001105 [Lithohypha guttulata]KAK5103133.1 hypothetical protein LTS08_003937 [Lithohypha guttulata]